MRDVLFANPTRALAAVDQLFDGVPARVAMATMSWCTTSVLASWHHGLEGFIVAYPL